MVSFRYKKDGTENTLGIDLQAYMFDKEDDAQAALDKAAADVNKILAEEAE